MSSDNREEIQYCQNRIQSLRSEIAYWQNELRDVYAAERQMGVTLDGSTSIPRRIESMEREISSLESRISSLRL